MKLLGPIQIILVIRKISTICLRDLFNLTMPSNSSNHSLTAKISGLKQASLLFINSPGMENDCEINLVDDGVLFDASIDMDDTEVDRLLSNQGNSTDDIMNEPIIDSAVLVPNPTPGSNPDANVGLHAENEVIGHHFRPIKQLDQKAEQKRRRTAGEGYTSIGTMNMNRPKVVQPHCCLPPSACKRSCREWTEEQRSSVFTAFYGLTAEQQNTWLSSHVETVGATRSRRIGSQRKTSNLFYLPRDGSRLQVCSKFFLKTLDITYAKVWYILDNRSKEGVPKQDNRGRKNGGTQSDARKRTHLVAFIESLPAVGSHYCRSSTRKKYLPQHLISFATIYRELYLTKTIEDDVEPAAYSTFMAEMKKYHVSFHKPKKDKCTTCTNPALDDTEKEAHLEEKISTVQQKDIDELKAQNDPTHLTMSFDLQKVLTSPRSPNNDVTLFYSRKYATYNFTVYNTKTSDGFCFMWGETEGKRGADEIATCLTKVFTMIDMIGIKTVTMWCDACSGQNKNKIVLTALTMVLANHPELNEIKLCFHLPGHSQMIVDSVHSVIENFVAKRYIWAPSQYVEAVRLCRLRPRPYRVVCLDHTSFVTFEETAKYLFPTAVTSSLKISTVREVRSFLSSAVL